MKLSIEDFDEESQKAIKSSFWHGLFFGALIVAPIVFGLAVYVVNRFS